MSNDHQISMARFGKEISTKYLQVQVLQVGMTQKIVRIG